LIATRVVASIFAAALVLPANPLLQGIVAVGLILIPGAALYQLFGFDQGTLGHRIVTVGALGVTGFYFISAIQGSVLPLIGVEHPFFGAPTTLTWIGVDVAVWIWLEVTRRDAIGELFRSAKLTGWLWLPVLAIPPLLSLVGVFELNAKGSSAFAILAASIAVAEVFIAVFIGSERFGLSAPALLSSAVVTIVWQLPFRGGWLDGWDIQHEYYVAKLLEATGRFPIPRSQDAYAGMLSITAWPVSLHVLSGMELSTAFALMPAFAVAGCVAASWYAVAHFAGGRASTVLVSVIVIGASSVLRHIASPTRQSWALFLFASLLMMIVTIPTGSKRLRVAIVFLVSGVAMSHYTTAYVAVAVLAFGWLVALLCRVDRSRQLLTGPVVGAACAVTALWDWAFAHTSRNFSQISHALASSGFQILPGTGGILSRWIQGGAAGTLVSASKLRVLDLSLRAHQYRWMTIGSSAGKVRLVNDPSPSVHGNAALGLGLSAISGVIFEGLLLAMVVSILLLTRRVRRGERRLAELLGMAIGAFLVGLLIRISGTLAVFEGAQRLQIQIYLVLVIAVAVAIQPFAAKLKRVPIILFAFLSAFCVSSSASSQLFDLVTPGVGVPAAFENYGEDYARIVTPSDVAAASWLAAHRRSGLVQADFWAQTAMFDFGGATRKQFIPSVDPVVTDNRAWILATHANVILHQARGGDTAELGVFRFPSKYFDATRSIVYVSTGDAVYGSMPK
jgi:hypothetical protein